MKKKEDLFLKGLIKLDIKPTPNKNFTYDTLARIKISGRRRFNLTHILFSPILVPVFGFAMLFLFSNIINLLVIIIPLLKRHLMMIQDKILHIVLDPVTITIILSFLILTFFDIYLNNERSRNFTKPYADYS